MILRVAAKLFKWLGYTLLFLFILFNILPYFFSVELNTLKRSDNPFSNSRFFSYNKTRVHYRTWMNAGDTCKGYVCLIHGFSGSTFSFRNNIDTFVKSGYLVVAVDLPAFGYSDKGDTACYNDSVRVEMIAKLLQHISPGVKWNMVGHSMGVSIVANVATQYPGLIKKMVFIDGPAFQTAPRKYSIANVLVVYPPLLRWSEVIGKHFFVNEDKFKDLLSSAYAVEPDVESIRGYMKPFQYQNSASSIFLMTSQSGFASIDTNVINSMPTALIWGEKDEWIPLKVADLFMKQNRKMEFHSIKDAGHCPMETHPMKVNAILLNFMEDAE